MTNYLNNKNWKVKITAPLLFLVTIVFLFTSACDRKPKTAFDEYGDALVDSYKRGQKAGDISNLDTVKKAVEMYRVEHSKNPESLDDIKDYLRSEVDLSKFDYNPENGIVSLKK